MLDADGGCILQVNAGFEVTGSEEKTAATEAEKAGTADSKTSVGLQQGPGGGNPSVNSEEPLSAEPLSAEAEEEKGSLQRFIDWLPFFKGDAAQEDKIPADKAGEFDHAQSVLDERSADVGGAEISQGIPVWVLWWEQSHGGSSQT